MVEFAMPRFGGEVAVRPSFERPEGVEESGFESLLRLRAWIAERLPLPEDFTLHFTGIVEKGGTLGNLKVIRTNNEGAAAAIFNLLTQAPRWSPGMGLTGQPVRVFRSFAMSFDPVYNGQIHDSEVSAEQVAAAAQEAGYTMPRFRGGDVADFRDWVTAQLVYPEQANRRGVHGTVLVHFKVDQQGRVGDITELHSPNPALSRAVLSVLKGSPRWTPGIEADGKPVSVYYIMPIIFRLREPRPEDQPSAAESESIAPPRRLINVSSTN